MDACLPDWNAEVRGDSHIPAQREPLGSENDLVELLWQDGGVVLNTQTNGRKQSKQPQDYEAIPWINSPIDESFERDFYANILSEVPPQNSSVAECSVRTINSSHCESNHVDMSWGSSSYGMKYGQNVSSLYQSATDKESLGPDFTSCSGGSNENNARKRKARDEESECRSDETGLDSAAGDKSSQKPGTSRRRRVAEVHNMSERRRRDRINERMKALQELIPHSSKSDKASMLDEAIEYMKSLQWQLQMMWMGSGMAPMMVPGMQHHMSRFGMGMGPQMIPGIQNLMHLSRLPRLDHVSVAARTNQALVSYQNQMQNYMGFHSVPNPLQPANMFPFGFHSAQQNTIIKPPGNSNGSMGSHAS